MMTLDFSNYSGGDLIPAGTIAVVQMRVQFGEGTDNTLTPTKDRTAEMLKAEFTVLEGEHAKRKVFGNWLVKGETEGQKTMAEKHLGTLKRILDSAHFLDPNDLSPEARAKRQVNFHDFDGLKFLAEIGVESGRDGFDDKNVVKRVITRDLPQWGGRPPLDQGPAGAPAAPKPNGPSSGGAAAAAPQAAPITKPAWAS
jgi:hypothetical protein